MPELPEVQTIASDLQDVVGGLTISEVAIGLPQIVASDLTRFISLTTGAKIDSVVRMGKWVRFNLAGLEGPAVMLAHLKMTGQFHLGPWPFGPDGHLKGAGQFPLGQKHDHAAFKLEGLPNESDTLFYRDIRQFGRLRAFDLLELDEFLKNLGQGPDPLTVEPDEFFQRLTARKGRLKCVLLDQTTVAGLGNIYVDEGLFAAGLWPTRSAATVTRGESDRLLAELKRLLAASIKARGSTTSNYQGLKGGGSFQKEHKVYGRAGEPCLCCGAIIERSVVGGRSTHCCPDCQCDQASKSPQALGGVE